MTATPSTGVRHDAAPQPDEAAAWTEASTQVATTHAPDPDCQALKEQFSEEEQVNLTLAITTIDAWNRPAVDFRSAPDMGGRVGRG